MRRPCFRWWTKNGDEEYKSVFEGYVSTIVCKTDILDA